MIASSCPMPWKQRAQDLIPRSNRGYGGRSVSIGQCSKPAKILLLAVIVALLPLRSMAALMAGSCAAAQEELPVAQSAVHAQDSGFDFGNADTHCPGPAFLANAAAAPILAPSDVRGIALVQRSAPTFFPDKLDRPPLALHR